MDEVTLVKRGPELGNSRFYMGNNMSFLLNGKEARGRFAIVSGHGRMGTEPPPHSHDFEDEIYYILEGRAEFWVEGAANSVAATPGDVVFLPQGKAHAVAFRSSSFRTLLMVQATSSHAVTLDTYFRDISEPASSMDLPGEQLTYALSDPTAAIEVAERNGVHFLSPEETKQRLPCNPGFPAPHLTDQRESFQATQDSEARKLAASRRVTLS